MKNASSKEF